jgi:hypothetical protein
MRSLIKNTVKNYIDYKSLKTSKRLLIIESDDWGSFRTMNSKVKDQLNKISKLVQEDPYIQLDNIADEEDLSALFETLQSVKDNKGNPACLTANVCTSNPNFEKIKENGFEQFYYKPFTTALKEYSKTQDLFKLWKNGMEASLFKPQLHGREHLHALAWLAELRAGNQDLLKAFELKSWGIPYQALLRQKRKNLQAALDVYHTEGESTYHKKWILEGAQIFEETFGFASKSFIAPAYIWHTDAHKYLVEANVNSLQGIKLQYEPNNHKKQATYNKKPHYLGKKDRNTKLIHFPRNTFFEPASAPEKDWVSITLKGIADAFYKNQPAIIGSHRINYIGSLNEKNRTDSLNMLKSILQKSIQQYPDLEFISSDRLVDQFYN